MFCHTKISLSESHSGFYPVYSEVVGIMNARKCAAETFQEVTKMSNHFRKASCEGVMNKCDREGEYVCYNGNATHNRECGCNYTAGYAEQQMYLYNPNNRTCFRPGKEFGDCRYLPCMNKSLELNPGKGIL